MADNKFLEVEIISPQKKIFSGNAVSVMLPGTKSPFEVLINHAPIVSSLDVGLVRIIGDGNEMIWFASSGGFAEVHRNKVSILVENAQKADEIDKEEVLSEIDKLLDERNNADTPALRHETDRKLNIQRNLIKAHDKIS